MNDKAIRNILIAYLKASNHEIRIYQEKSIGTSICDVMAVTDRLTGYEIKSDLDNYFRLAGQIKAYAEQKYLVPMGDTPAGNARRVINALKEFQKFADQGKEHLDKVVSRKEELQNLVRSPDHSYSDQLAACEKEVSRLREQIAVRAECGAFTD